MEAGSGDLTLMRWIGDIRLPFVEPKLGVILRQLTQKPGPSPQP
jgi:hypothetical protein